MSTGSACPWLSRDAWAGRRQSSAVRPRARGLCCGIPRGPVPPWQARRAARPWRGHRRPRPAAVLGTRALPGEPCCPSAGRGGRRGAAGRVGSACLSKEPAPKCWGRRPRACCQLPRREAAQTRCKRERPRTCVGARLHSRVRASAGPAAAGGWRQETEPGLRGDGDEGRADAVHPGPPFFLPGRELPGQHPRPPASRPRARRARGGPGLPARSAARWARRPHRLHHPRALGTAEPPPPA